jgi:hypothetical protein
MMNPVDMNDQQLRLECLRLASQKSQDPDEIVDRAERYYEFLVGPKEE